MYAQASSRHTIPPISCKAMPFSAKQYSTYCTVYHTPLKKATKFPQISPIFCTAKKELPSTSVGGDDVNQVRRLVYNQPAGWVYRPALVGAYRVDGKRIQTFGIRTIHESSLRRGWCVDGNVCKPSPFGAPSRRPLRRGWCVVGNGYNPLQQAPP